MFWINIKIPFKYHSISLSMFQVIFLLWTRYIAKNRPIIESQTMWHIVSTEEASQLFVVIRKMILSREVNSACVPGASSSSGSRHKKRPATFRNGRINCGCSRDGFLFLHTGNRIPEQRHETMERGLISRARMSLPSPARAFLSEKPTL